MPGRAENGAPWRRRASRSAHTLVPLGDLRADGDLPAGAIAAAAPGPSVRLAQQAGRATEPSLRRSRLASTGHPLSPLRTRAFPERPRGKLALPGASSGASARKGGIAANRSGASAAFAGAAGSLSGASAGIVGAAESRPGPSAGKVGVARSRSGASAMGPGFCRKGPRPSGTPCRSCRKGPRPSGAPCRSCRNRPRPSGTPCRSCRNRPRPSGTPCRNPRNRAGARRIALSRYVSRNSPSEVRWTHRTLVPLSADNCPPAFSSFSSSVANKQLI